MPNRLQAMWMTGFALLLLIGCGGTPDPAPPPPPRIATNPAKLAEHPWDLTPPDAFLAFAPGAEGQSGAPLAVERAARLWLRLTDASVPAADRAAALLDRMRPTCAIGRYGLPLEPTNRALFARMFVHHLDAMAGDVDALSLPWHYRLITVREFATLPPEAVDGWSLQLRLPDLPALLESGGTIVLLGPEGDVGNWMLCTVWLPGAEKMAALHVLRVRREGNP